MDKNKMFWPHFFRLINYPQSNVILFFRNKSEKLLICWFVGRLTNFVHLYRNPILADWSFMRRTARTFICHVRFKFIGNLSTQAVSIENKTLLMKHFPDMTVRISFDIEEPVGINFQSHIYHWGGIAINYNKTFVRESV